MGVLGLTPFLQKTCPEVIKKLPDRLRSLRGKTIVIDGTLITQRLHFASIPSDHRHVLGWYKIIQELKDSGVQAICVFDGQERNTAKARETARRRELRKQDEARGSIEVERLKRLRKLIGLVGEYRSLPSTDRERVTVTLKEFISNTRISGAFLLSSVVIGNMRKPLVADDIIEQVSGRVHESDDSLEVMPAEDAPIQEDSTPPIQASTEPDISQSINEVSWFTSYLEGSGLTDSDLRDILLARINHSSQDFVTPSVVSQESHLNDEDPYLPSQVDELSNDDAVVDEDLASVTLSTEAAIPETCIEDATPPYSHDHPPLAENESRRQSAADLDDNNTSSRKESEHQTSTAFEKGAQNQDITATEHDQPSLITEDHRIDQDTDPDQDSKFPEMEATTDGSATETKDIESAFLSLYLDYCRSIPKLTSLSSPNYTSPTPLPSQDLSEVQMEYVMSKQQLQLTVDEGKIWDELVEHRSSVPDAGSELQEGDMTGVALASLAEKSTTMSQSYERRNNPPTSQTYEESKQIIKALGVPCVDSTGAYEAEALAASLVINGHADYVASEDTDVLVYEAPLVRGITSRVEPLTIVSGSDIRTVLQLDRASFIDFALLLGTDFSQRIKNVGPQRALKFIREHGSIERVIERERKYSPRGSEKAYLEQVEIARLVFQTLPPIPDVQLLQAKDSDDELVSTILQRYGLHRVVTYNWDHTTALDGNYFQDNPSAF